MSLLTNLRCYGTITIKGKKDMNRATLEITKKLAKRLREKLGKVQVIIYGSRARGNGVTGSDLDVCIVVERLDKETRDKVFTIAWRSSLEERIVITPLIFGRKEWEDSPILESPIYKNIQREGIKVE